MRVIKNGEVHASLKLVLTLAEAQLLLAALTLEQPQDSDCAQRVRLALAEWIDRCEATEESHD